MKKSVFLLIVSGLAVVAACVWSGIQSPRFSNGTDEVKDDVKEISGIDDVSFKWGRERYGDSIEFFLCAELIDSTGFPEDDSLLDEIGREVMVNVLNSLENKSDYTIFRVDFLLKNQKGEKDSAVAGPFLYRKEDLN